MPPKKRRRWLAPSLIGGGIALALCCGGTIIAAAASDPDEKNTSVDAPAALPTGPGASEAAKAAELAKSEAPPAGPKKYKVGETVRGGDFAFVVHGVKCGIVQVRDSFLSRKAQGAFCRADVSVKNVTKKAHLFHADGTVSAQDAGDREYEADGEANMYGNKDGNKDGAGFLDARITFDAGLFTLAEDAVVAL